MRSLSKPRRHAAAVARCHVVRFLFSRSASRRSARSRNAARSAALPDAWVGAAQAVGHCVMPLARINGSDLGFVILQRHQRFLRFTQICDAEILEPA